MSDILKNIFNQIAGNAQAAANVTPPAGQPTQPLTPVAPTNPGANPGPSAENGEVGANGQLLNKPNSMEGQHQHQQQHGVAQPGTVTNGDPNAPTPGAQPTEQPPSLGSINGLDFFMQQGDNSGNGEAETVPTFALNPETLQQAAQAQDFTRDLDPEILAKLSSGDLSALPELLNAVGRAAYSQSLQHGAALTDKFVNQHSEYQSKQLAPMVREQLTHNELNSAQDTTLDLSNPVVSAAVADKAKELARQHPHLPPAQVAQKAKEFYINIAATMMGANANELQKLPGVYKEQQQQTASEVTDWGAYLSNDH